MGIPRRYTKEQILFVMDRLDRVKNSDIVNQYNARFRSVGGEITKKQLKYLRLTYGTDPSYG
jgi:hypothetical protein